MRRNRLMKVMGLLLGISLVLGLTATSEAKKPNPAEENIVIIQSASPSPWYLKLTPDPLIIRVNKTGTVHGEIVPSYTDDEFTSPKEGDVIKDAEGNTIAEVTKVSVVKGKAEITVTGVAPGEGIMKASAYSPTAKETCPASITVAVIKLELDLFKVGNGKRVPDGKEETVGGDLSINNDDDNEDEKDDYLNTEIDGPKDRKDMAKMKLDFQPWDLTYGTIELTATDPTKIRAFNENDQPVSLPETIKVSKKKASRFKEGPIYYYVEGLSAGSVTLTLSFTESSVIEDKVKLVIGKEVGIKLTFDDGPCPAQNRTRRILQILADNKVEKNIKAAFFVQTHAPQAGGHLEGPGLMKAEKDAGHHVEVHTGNDEGHNGEYYHTKRVLPTAKAYDADGDGDIDADDGENVLESDLIRAKARIKQVTGRAPVKVRPPAGKYNPKVLEVYDRQDLTMQLWDVDTEDWKENDALIMNNLSKESWGGIPFWVRKDKESIVILFHDIKENTATNLKNYLKLIEDLLQWEGRNVRFDLL